MRFNLHFTHWSLLFITLISSCFLFYVVASENAKYVTTKQTVATDASMASAATAASLPADQPTYHDAASVAAPHIDDSINADDQLAENVNPTENRKDQTINILPNYKKLKKTQTSPQPLTLEVEHNDENHKIVPPNNLEGNWQNSPPQHTDSDFSSKSDNDEIVVDNTVVENSKVVNTNENIMIVGRGDNVNGDNEYDIHSSFEAQYAGDISDNGNGGSGGGGGDSGNFVNQQVPAAVESETLNKNGGVDIINEITDDSAESLPDITDIPTVTITELPLEILQPPQNSLESVIITADVVGEQRIPDESVNRTVDIIINKEDEIQKDGQIVKINDSSGLEDTGGIQASTAIPTPATIVEPHQEPTITTPSPSATNIPSDATKANDTKLHHSATRNDSLEQQNASASSSASETGASQVNLTTEEVPMPVFSEWAQKQMEAAEKQEQQQQEQTFNNSAQRKNNTNGNGKPPTLKIRAKNYASPDCGAKIIASSAYTSNAGAVLSASKDEYMLSLCGNRIWFVVELCEAIQAQKIDFANFELYSSSPQNFTVAVSKRFPTREWSNVGRFVADDKRAVQGFDLHPHLFGKFVRVDIHSHYSKEHFCTLSLFRVFGTSEFEAFETENHPNDDLDDFDDEDLQEQNNAKSSEQNLFKSASDAVLSIVKKATELVGKPSNSQNQTFKTSQHSSVVCRTPVYGLFNCAECSASLVERVNNALSCEFSQLNSLLNIADIRNDLLNTRVCTKRYGIETKQSLSVHKDIRQSFYINMLPNAYVGALCQLLATPKTYQKLGNNTVIDNSENETSETSANQTMDKKFGKEDLELLEKPENKLIKPEMPIVDVKPAQNLAPELAETATEIPLDENQQQLPRPSLEPEEEMEVTTVTPKNIETPSIPDKNIFNVPVEELAAAPPTPETVLAEQQNLETVTTTSSGDSIEQPGNGDATLTATGATNAMPPKVETVTTTPQPVQPKSEEDSNSWDNIESLLTSTPSSTIPSGGGSHQNNGGAAGGGGFQNPKLSNGGPQTESVFIRLSNRIKALERNMSLSGQYLEELSRRYKKQVEELQQTLTQQIQTVRTLEEQNRRHNELEELYAQRNTQLKHELDDLTLQVHACIVVIIFVGAFVFLVLMVSILFYRSLRRDTKEVLALYGKGGNKKAELSNSASVQKKLNRRKSFEDFSEHQQRREQHIQCLSGNEKFRRPSEEAMLILKDCKGDSKVVVGSVKAGAPVDLNLENNGPVTGRQRKLSVCYGSNNNINGNTSSLVPLQKSIGAGGKQRRGEKHSWPNTAQAQLLAKQHLEQLNNDEIIGDAPEISSAKSKLQPVGKSKKKKDYLRRQESSPAESTNILNNTSSPTDLNQTADFDEKLMLDEDDLDNFIPNADLAYNEFMPDGPRGYQCVALQANANNPASKKAQLTKSDGNSKKARRLSSPVFFKSPFTKSLKGKITSSKSNPPHESTSWEWYRLKKSSSANGPNAAANSTTTTTTNAFLRVSPNASLDSSSLSEINFPTNSTENSFRILEEAILSSGESAITTTTTGSSSTNGGGNSSRSGHRSVGATGGGGGGGDNMVMTSGISSSSNSNRSSSSNSSSTQSKKKNRSFNKIFRKVF